LKLEGIRDCAEVWVAALMEGRDKYILGRRTMPKMDLAKLLAMPKDSYTAAVLCIGHVDEFYPKPLLEEAGWDSRRGLDEILYENSWGTACSIL
jgi:5,6-dimethylbenzimidazole synthase